MLFCVYFCSSFSFCFGHDVIVYFRFVNLNIPSVSFASPFRMAPVELTERGASPVNAHGLATLGVDSIALVFVRYLGLSSYWILRF